MRQRAVRQERAGYRGRRRSLWVKALCALLLAGVLVFSALLALVMGGVRDDVEGDPQVMVILGCQLHSWGPSVMLQDRLDRALEYLEEHPDMTVVVTGGQGADEPEAEAETMARYLTERGFPQEQVLLEDRSHNTFQNFAFTRTLLEERGYDLSRGVVVVSNGFHLARAKMLAGRVGFVEVSTLAAPSSHTPSLVYMLFREPIALIKSFLIDR